jgi:RNA-binding protein
VPSGLIRNPAGRDKIGARPSLLSSGHSVPQARTCDEKQNMALNNRQIRFLRGLTHKLSPIVMVGDKGLNENIYSDIDTALDHHELIKVRIRADREQRRKWMAEIADRCNAERVHTIGQVACYYRRNPDQPKIELPV